MIARDEVHVEKAERGYVVRASGFYSWQETRSEALDWARRVRQEGAAVPLHVGRSQRETGTAACATRGGEEE